MGAQTLPFHKPFPPPPSHLGAEGKRAWSEGEELWRVGQLIERDLGAWRLYAEAWDEKDRCIKILKKEGEYFTSAHGCRMEHPAIKRRNRAEGQIYRYQKLFGLVPDARKKRPAVQQGVASRPK